MELAEQKGCMFPSGECMNKKRTVSDAIFQFFQPYLEVRRKEKFTNNIKIILLDSPPSKPTKQRQTHT